MDGKTLELMDKWKRYKNAKDEQQKVQYKKLRNEVQRRCRKTQNKWIDGKYKEEETLFRIWKVNVAHRKIKENLTERRDNANIVRDKNGKALTESRDKFR